MSTYKLYVRGCKISDKDMSQENETVMYKTDGIQTATKGNRN